MSNPSYIRGIVIRDGTTEPEAGLTVHLGRRDQTRFYPLGSAFTGADGRFAFDLTLLDAKGGRGRSYEVRVLKHGLELEAHGNTRWPVATDPGPLTLCVEYPETCGSPAESPAAGPDDLDFHGRVRHVDGTPVANVAVQVRSVGLDGDDVEATTTTDGDGWYSVDLPEQYDGPNRFIVKVLDAQSAPPILLGSSRAQYAPTLPVRLDIEIGDDRYRQPSEFSRLHGVLTLALDSGAPGDLDVHGIAVLSGQCGLDVERITLWVLAHKIGTAIPVDEDSIESIYGLLRLGFPRSTEALLARSRASIPPALSRAARLNLISQERADASATLDSAFAAGVKSRLTDGRDDRLGTILAASGVLAQDQIDEFVDFYVDYEGDDGTFWTEVANLSLFDEESAAEAKRLVTLGALSVFFAPAVQAIVDHIGPSGADGVAALTTSDWTAIVGALPSLPQGLDGDTEEERRAAFASLLKDHAEMAFPAETARAAILVELALTPEDPLKTFLENNSTFDFAAPWEGSDAYIFDEEVELKAARVAQRLYRVSPTVNRAEAVLQLRAGGFTSAHSIARVGKKRFVDWASPLLGEEDAVTVHRKAVALAGLATTFAIQAHPTQAGQTYRFLPSTGEEVTPDIPDWETLFGNVDYCACGHCRSVLSPAAYLVDLLFWLDGRTASDGKTALQHLVGDDSLEPPLVGRRPDLTKIKLTCENTNRTLPYIDLVLEALESIVDPAGGSEGSVTEAAAHESLAESPEMLAAPQYVNNAAYDKLAEASTRRAMSLPFHRPLAEARAFLGHLGVHRGDLLLAFQDGSALEPYQVALEDLGLSEEGLKAITENALVGVPESEFWAAGSYGDLASPRVFMRAAGVSWSELLDLLHTRHVNPDLTIGETTFERTLRVQLAGEAPDPCDVDDYQIVRRDAVTGEWGAEPSDDDWRRFRQFIRLWRATGWSIIDLDRVLLGFGITDLKITVPGEIPEWVTTLGMFRFLSRKTGLEPVPLVSWWSDVDTWADRDTQEVPSDSLFDRVFLNRMLFRQEGDSNRTLFEQIKLGGLPDPRLGDLADQKSMLQAMLGIDSAAFDALKGALDVDSESTDDTTLSLANLSALYRRVSLARVLRLKVEDARALFDLIGGAPFEGSPPGSLTDVVGLLDGWGTLAAQGWTVDELRYLTRHVAVERVGPTDSFIQAMLGRLRDTLRPIYAEITADTTEAGIRDSVVQVLAEQLGVDRATLGELQDKVFPHLPAPQYPVLFTSVEDTAFTFATTVTGVTVPEGVAFTLPAGTDYLPEGANPEDPPSELAEDTLCTILSTADHIVGLNSVGVAPRGTGWELQSVDRAKLPAQTLVRFAEGEHIVLDAGSLCRTEAGDIINLVNGTPGELVEEVELSLSTDGVCVLPDTFTVGKPLVPFLRTEFIGELPEETSAQPWEDITRESATYGPDFQVAEIWFKAALVLKRLGIDAAERAFWYGAADVPESELPPITELSADAGIAAVADFDVQRFGTLVRLYSLRDRIPGTSPTFAELLALVGDPEDFASALSQRAGWVATDVYDAAGPSGAAVGLDLASAAGLSTLLDRLALVRRVGVSAQVVAGWCVSASVADLTPEISAEVVFAARSRYSDARAWGAVARPVRDVLRKAQRDALVSYLLSADSSGSLEDADDLYEKHLIDVSMNPEMLTSRIKQACCTVQLFVQRCLLGLELADGEPLVDFNDDDKAQWEWMRTYRVWEAARKVFLYPENWIEPELRDDKSPFFKALETELAQGDMTDARAEQAVLTYLDQLREVSNLQVVTYYVEKEDFTTADNIDRIHVFARTAGEPPDYWYRRFEDGTTWTVWEKVGCAPKGVYLAPIVHERALFLFWAEISEAADGKSENIDANYHEVRVAWSEYRNGKWSPKRVSTEAGVHGHLKPGQEPYYRLRAHHGSEGQLQLTLEILLGQLSAETDTDPSLTDYEPVTAGTFVWDGCRGGLVLLTANDSEQVLEWQPPPETIWAAPFFELNSGNTLKVQQGDVDENGEAVEGSLQSVTLLENISEFKLTPPHQFYEFVSQAPFFVQSGGRVWFVESPTLRQVTTAGIQVVDASGGSVTFQAGDEVTDVISDEELQDLSGLVDSTRYEDVPVVLVNAGVPANLPGASSFPILYSIMTQAATDLVNVERSTNLLVVRRPYRFHAFHHPYVCTFIQEVRREGVFALLDPEPQGPVPDLSRQQLRLEYFGDLVPDPQNVAEPYPVDDIDFEGSGAYAPYNWETFFHVPFYVANRLADNGRHDDAMRWFHAIFDPRMRYIDPTLLLAPPDGPGYPPSAVWWKVKPFMEPVSAPVTNWNEFTGADGDAEAADSFARQVSEWLDDPFNPHLLARLRPGTYQKSVVMKYIDNLIAWGDRLFIRDTIETLNEATQLYVFARQILGDRPVQLEPSEKPTALTFSDLISNYDPDEFGNVLIENAYPYDVTGTGSGDSGVVAASGVSVPYFCVPPNPTLLSYWDIVEDRLFKIRNGLNIEGVARTLPLFEPPIDPALLVRAAAAGLDISTVLDALGGSRTPYRFSVMVQRAQALAGSVRSLAAALLAALEKRDAEALALLRSEHEVALLERVREVRERQVDEARTNLDAMRRSRGLAEARRDYYARLVEKGWIPAENSAAELTLSALGLELAAGITQTLASIVGVIPDITAGLAAGVETGGQNFSRVAGAVGQGLAVGASSARGVAGYLSTVAAYQRRAQEWNHQKALAALEVEQIGKQIVAAELRLEIARKELRNHDLQIAHAEQVKEWMTTKYTNEELYQWMVGQLAAVYYQSFQLAVSTARKAEASYNHEIGRQDSFIQSTYWDSLRKGLLAGERLTADLERMDAAYLDNDQREFELTKHVSLDLLDPVALVRLREEGECYFELPEALFDLDCPGQYLRRISSVGVTLACVNGPQSGVNAQLTLHKAFRRDEPKASAELEEDTGLSYPSIVISGGPEDTGLFQTDLKDVRYLPFERHGAISTWHLRLTAQQYKQIDWATLSDVVLHLRYTARDGGASFRAEVEAGLAAKLDALVGGDTGLGGAPTTAGLVAAVSARRDFADAWYLAQNSGAMDVFEVAVGDAFLPEFAQGGRVDGVPRVHVFAVGPAGGSPTADLYLDGLRVNSEGEAPSQPTSLNPWGGSGVVYWGRWSPGLTALPGTLKVQLKAGFTFDDLSDLVAIVEYSVS